MTDEQRRHDRIPLCIDVRMFLAGGAVVVLESADISNGGVFLLHGGAAMPPVGTDVRLQVVDGSEGQERPIVPAKVVRSTEIGIGLEFVTS
jgi:hypothetical protein